MLNAVEVSRRVREIDGHLWTREATEDEKWSGGMGDAKFTFSRLECDIPSIERKLSVFMLTIEGDIGSQKRVESMFTRVLGTPEESRSEASTALSWDSEKVLERLNRI